LKKQRNLFENRENLCLKIINIFALVSLILTDSPSSRELLSNSQRRMTMSSQLLWPGSMKMENISLGMANVKIIF